MDLGIHGKVAIVGGSSKGLGRASAESLAKEGVSLMLCARNQTTLEQTAHEIHAAYGNEVRTYAADLELPNSITGLVAATIQHYGTVDILISNIGGPPPGSADDLDEVALQIGIDRTYLFFIRMARAVLPTMKAQKQGRIISILSFSIKEVIDNLVLSTSARMGAAGFLKGLSRDVAGTGITVNNVLPGTILTDRQLELASAQARRTGQTAEEVMELNAKMIPMGHMGQPGDIGSLVAFLASDKAAYITGTNIAVDGGLSKAVL